MCNNRCRTTGRGIITTNDYTDPALLLRSQAIAAQNNGDYAGALTYLKGAAQAHQRARDHLEEARDYLKVALLIVSFLASGPDDVHTAETYVERADRIAAEDGFLQDTDYVAVRIQVVTALGLEKKDYRAALLSAKEYLGSDARRDHGRARSYEALLAVVVSTNEADAPEEGVAILENHLDVLYDERPVDYEAVGEAKMLLSTQQLLAGNRDGSRHTMKQAALEAEEHLGREHELTRQLRGAAGLDRRPRGARR